MAERSAIRTSAVFRRGLLCELGLAGEEFDYHYDMG
jgi:hypothetical protein